MMNVKMYVKVLNILGFLGDGQPVMIKLNHGFKYRFNQHIKFQGIPKLTRRILSIKMCLNAICWCLGAMDP